MAQKKVKAHVSDEKKQVVKEFTKLIDSYPIIAAVDVENLPAKQLMNMRTNLRGKAELRMTKRRLINIALDNSKKENIVALKAHLTGMPALLFSKETPFALFKILKKSKSPAPIKAGQKAPKNIVIKAGPTGFAPGPIIGELGAFGIKAGIDAGKVAVKEDKIVAKEGEVVSAKLAAILQRLNIQPMEIGLNLTAAYENGEILTKNVLDIDEEAFIKSIQNAFTDSLKLSLALKVPTKENIVLMLQNAHLDAYKLAEAQSIITADNVERILAKADSQAQAVKAEVDKKAQ